MLSFVGSATQNSLSYRISSFLWITYTLWFKHYLDTSLGSFTPEPEFTAGFISRVSTSWLIKPSIVRPRKFIAKKQTTLLTAVRDTDFQTKSNILLALFTKYISCGAGSTSNCLLYWVNINYGSNVAWTSMCIHFKSKTTWHHFIFIANFEICCLEWQQVFS